MDKREIINILEKIIPDYDFTFDTDYAHFIPRKDKIALSKDRVFKVIK